MIFNLLLFFLNVMNKDLTFRDHAQVSFIYTLIYLPVWNVHFQMKYIPTLKGIILLKRSTEHEPSCHHLKIFPLVSSVVDRGFKPWSSQNKDYKIGICSFSAKHAALRRKSSLVGSESGWSVWVGEAKCLSEDCCFSELAL